MERSPPQFKNIGIKLQIPNFLVRTRFFGKGKKKEKVTGNQLLTRFEFLTRKDPRWLNKRKNRNSPTLKRLIV